MSKRPENSDPIASAGQIDDPDQPVTRNDDKATQQRDAVDEKSEGADQRVRSHHTVSPAGSGTSHDDESVARGSGKPPKAVKETGFPNVNASTVDAQHDREIDSESVAADRKFQPPEGRVNPNENHLTPPSGDPHVFPGADVGQAADGDRGGDKPEAEAYGTPDNTRPPEPVEHSRKVEERIQEQERDFDLGVTEEGERYITPRDPN